jgi:hypothetical protein
MLNTGWQSFRHQMKGLLAGRLRLALALCSVALLILLGQAFAGPSGPPPHGKVWVEVGGQWILVLAPPSDGPYRWVEGRWVPDATPPPPGTEWVPGHWGPSGWVHGHWARVPVASPGAVWVPGRWDGSVWVAGHWKGALPAGKRWVPGQRGRYGRWAPGHWR